MMNIYKERKPDTNPVFSAEWILEHVIKPEKQFIFALYAEIASRMPGLAKILMNRYEEIKELEQTYIKYKITPTVKNEMSTLQKLVQEKRDNE